MLIKYKNYVGVLIYACQIESNKFEFRIKDIDEVIISFQAKINEIRIVDCIGNADILAEVNKK